MRHPLQQLFALSDVLTVAFNAKLAQVTADQDNEVGRIAFQVMNNLFLASVSSQALKKKSGAIGLGFRAR